MNRQHKKWSKPRVFLDSGAYSAWSHNKTIDVRDYIVFVKQVKDHVWCYVNLDVIPGSIDRVRSLEEVEASAAKSYENLERMRDAGLRPLPVFHQGESFSWLEKMIEDGEEYIGISTAKNQPNPVQERWLDQFFTAITDNKGRPIVKIHGFGSAHVSLLKRLPWKSVDSAGWIIAAAYGKMYVPCYTNGKPDYLADPLLVTISGNFQETKHSQFRQYENYGPLQQAAVRQFLEEEVGCDVGMARHDAYWRYQALAVYYVRVSEYIKDVRFRHPKPDFVQQQGRISGQPAKISSLDFVFSTAYDKKQFEVLRAAGAKYDLLSYFALKGRPEAIEQYLNGQFRERPAVGLKREEQKFSNHRYRDARARALITRIASDAAETARETVAEAGGD
jgi:hypothetical protein